MDLNQRVAGNVHSLMVNSTPKKNRADLARIIGCSEHTAGRKINGTSQWTTSEMDIVAGWLNVRPAQLMSPIFAESEAA